MVRSAGYGVPGLEGSAVEQGEAGELGGYLERLFGVCRSGVFTIRALLRRDMVSSLARSVDILKGT